jgi:hypothetical protein
MINKPVNGRWCLRWVILAGFGTVSACGPDLSTFSVAPSVETLALANIRATKSWDFLALRLQNGPMDTGTPPVWNATDEGCRPDHAPSPCADALTNRTVDGGFHLKGCDPNACYFHLVRIKGGEVEMYTSREALVAFFGEIDTPEEALLLAFADGYNWSGFDIRSGAYKSVLDGYEIIAGRSESVCPSTYSRNHLLVQRDGSIVVIGSQTSGPSGYCV